PHHHPHPSPHSRATAFPHRPCPDPKARTCPTQQQPAHLLAHATASPVPATAQHTPTTLEHPTPDRSVRPQQNFSSPHHDRPTKARARKFCPHHHHKHQPQAMSRDRRPPRAKEYTPKTQSGEAGHTSGRSVDVQSHHPRTSENEDHHRCPTRSSAYATGSPPTTPPPHRWPTCSVTDMTPTPWPSPKSAPHSPPPP